jgi:hypothetical protein
VLYQHDRRSNRIEFETKKEKGMLGERRKEIKTGRKESEKNT